MLGSGLPPPGRILVSRTVALAHFHHDTPLEYARARPISFRRGYAYIERGSEGCGQGLADVVTVDSYPKGSRCPCSPGAAHAYTSTVPMRTFARDLSLLLSRIPTSPLSGAAALVSLRIATRGHARGRPVARQCGYADVTGANERRIRGHIHKGAWTSSFWRTIEHPVVDAVPFMHTPPTARAVPHLL